MCLCSVCVCVGGGGGGGGGGGTVGRGGVLFPLREATLTKSRQILQNPYDLPWQLTISFIKMALES